MMKYFHQLHLGADEKPSWQPGCYKQAFSQPAFQMGSLLLLLTEAYDIKPNDAQCYQGNHT